MPGKVNPVIPEAVSQVAMLVMGYDATIAAACGLGSLELNAFLPLVADLPAGEPHVLAHACEILRRHCVEGIEADEERCARARPRLERRRHRARARARLRGGLRRRARKAAERARRSATWSSPTAC